MSILPPETSFIFKHCNTTERLRSHRRDEGIVSISTTYFGIKVMS